MNDPIKILGLRPGDTLTTAKKNRNKLFLKIHPDKDQSEKEKYQQVYDAYDYLENHPEMLDTPTEDSIDFIRLKVDITIEDIYLQKIKTITYNRKIFCKKCAGTGSDKGSAGQCSHCEGKGKIDSEILILMGKDSTCPVCKGSGIEKGSTCDRCYGSKYENEIKTLKFIARLSDYHNKLIILNNAGHQTSNSSYGKILIRLNVISDQVTIEEDYFVVYDKVLPVQKIIGDIKTINIFDRDITYKIEKNSTEAYTKDRITSTLTQTLRIKFITIEPKFSDETISLYKEILRIEKQNEFPF